MLNKEKIIEQQISFSRMHTALIILMLCFIGFNLTIDYSTDGVKILPCLLICLILLIDIFFAYCSFFHNYNFLLVLRFLELTAIGCFISDAGDVGIGGVSDFFIILFYFVILSELVYMIDFTDSNNRIKTAIICQSPFLLKIIICLVLKSYHFSNYILMSGIFSITIYSITNYIGTFQNYFDTCIFAKDRLIDKSKENYDKIDENQHALVLANENLGIKKYELEEANRKIQSANNEANLVNSMLKTLNSTMDLSLLMKETSDNFMKNFDIIYSGLIFKDPLTRKTYNSGIEDLLGEDVNDFYDFFFSSAFMNTHNGIGRNYFNNEVSFDEFPFFEKTGVRSLVATAMTSCPSEYHCIYILLSKKNNTFTYNNTVFDSIFTQIDVTGQNLYLYQQVRELSIKDPLSGLYNNRFLTDYFKRNFMDTKDLVVSLALIDIDHFKVINDTYGHLFGNEAIKGISQLIKTVAKEQGGTGFRYGGEEFILLIKGKDLKTMHDIMEDFRTRLKATEIKGDDFSVYLKASIGISTYPETIDNLSMIIDRADKAMYYSKQHGRDRITDDNDSIE